MRLSYALPASIARGLALACVLGLGTLACKSGGSPPPGAYDVEVEAPPDPSAPPVIVDGRLQGPMNKAFVDVAVAKETPKFEACRDREILLGRAPAAEATYEFELRLSPAGQRHQVTLMRTTHPDQVSLDRCISDVLNALVFPGFQGEPFVTVVILRPTPKP